MTIITLKYVNQPKTSTGKMGSVVDMAGTRYMVPTENLGWYIVGASYDVAVSQETWKAGEAPVMVIRGLPTSAGTGTSPPAPSAPLQRTPSVHVNGAKVGEAAARQIFVTGIVGRAMGSGKFTPADVDALTSSAIAAYDRHLG
jgi:hypothetical protein